MKTQILITALSLTLAGCAATGPAFKPVQDVKAGQGTLYIYRPDSRALMILSAVIQVDGKPVATLENNGYVAIAIPAGQHEVRHEWKAGVFGNSKLEGKPVFTRITIRTNQATYVRLLSQARSQVASDVYYPNIGINTQFQWVLEEVPEKSAIVEIRQTKGAKIEF